MKNEHIAHKLEKALKAEFEGRHQSARTHAFEGSFKSELIKAAQLGYSMGYALGREDAHSEQCPPPAEEMKEIPAVDEKPVAPVEPIPAPKVKRERKTKSKNPESQVQ